MFETVIAVLALVVSAINVILYFKLQGKYNEMTETQMLTAQGAIETQIRSEISNASKELRYWGVAAQKEPENQIVQQAFFSAEEEYRNAYEDACGKYIDKKIDAQRFEKMYKQEINKLVNNPDQAQFYATNQTPYASTVEVYKRWFAQS